MTAMLLFMTVSQTWAQSITYNHDSSKMEQIKVMELGAGNLTPELYYTMLHNSYKKGAKEQTSVKNTLRTTTNVNSLPQVEYADSIKADLESRAKVEALNMADRTVDVAWLTEGKKIEDRLLTFKNNISCLNGKTQNEEIEAWTELGKTYDFAIKVTKKAYMPNSERQRQYISIYANITQANDNLILRVRYLAMKKQADDLATAMSNFQHRTEENAKAAYNRWRNASEGGTSGDRTINK